jgi:hypothetical protein
MTRETSITMAYRNNYQFELRHGGIGHGGEVTTTPSVGRELPFVVGEQITVYNDGDVAIWFAVGGPNILATTSCTPIPPGDKEVFTISKDGGVYTHISWVTRIGLSFATVNLGFGS